MNVKEFVLSELQKRRSFEETINIEKLNYVQSGYVDSLGLIQFVSAIEEHFNIEFTDEEISEESFQNLGELIKLINEKLKQ